jgi:hypothetical protein
MTGRAIECRREIVDGIPVFTGTGECLAAVYPEFGIAPVQSDGLAENLMRPFEIAQLKPYGSGLTENRGALGIARFGHRIGELLEPLGSFVHLAQTEKRQRDTMQGRRPAPFITPGNRGFESGLGILLGLRDTGPVGLGVGQVRQAYRLRRRRAGPAYPKGNGEDGDGQDEWTAQHTGSYCAGIGLAA